MTSLEAHRLTDAMNVEQLRVLRLQASPGELRDHLAESLALGVCQVARHLEHVILNDQSRPHESNLWQVERDVKTRSRRRAPQEVDLAVQPAPEGRLGLGADGQLGERDVEPAEELHAVLGGGEDGRGAARPPGLGDAGPGWPADSGGGRGSASSPAISKPSARTAAVKASGRAMAVTRKTRVPAGSSPRRGADPPRPAGTVRLAKPGPVKP